LSINLEDLREVERDLNRRFNRIEEGMNLMMDVLTHMKYSDDENVTESWQTLWDDWKGHKPMQYNPTTKRHE
jgi:hypothetical protein